VTRKLAERVVAWRWYIIAGWIVLGAVLVVLAPSLNNFTSSGYGRPPRTSRRRQRRSP
jgi:uncharacterized membrane protein YdfJ with MMPL/SSD domain